jgi:hypothetical protein
MTFEGTVEARNERGIKLDGEWRNVSRFHPLALPEVGQRVRAEVDGKGFLKSVELLEEASPLVSPSRGQPQSDRLAVLQAAAHFAAGRTDIKSADVLRIADGWLAWVLKDDP